MHKDGKRMRKPAMEVSMEIPPPQGIMANPQQIQQANERPVRVEHVLELPPKAVRGACAKVRVREGTKCYLIELQDHPR